MTAATEKREKLQLLKECIADHCVDIERMFKEPVKVTVIVRDPERPDGSRDVIVSSDDYEKAIEAMRVCVATGEHVS